jgi:hypothetical protein
MGRGKVSPLPFQLNLHFCQAFNPSKSDYCVYLKYFYDLVWTDLESWFNHEGDMDYGSSLRGAVLYQWHIPHSQDLSWAKPQAYKLCNEGKGDLTANYLWDGENP